MPPEADYPTPDSTRSGAAEDWPGCVGVMGWCGRSAGINIERLDEPEADKTARPNPKYRHMFCVLGRTRRDAAPN